MAPTDRILVTGGGGMLAAAFKKALPSARFLSHADLDITNSDALTRFINEFRPTHVINCAADAKVDRAEQMVDSVNAINGHAVGNLAALCRQHKAMLIHFSTDYVFDGTIRRPLRIDDPVGPQSAYGRSKLLGEKLLQENAPKQWLIVRTAWLYGPGGASFPRSILSAARAGKPLTVVDDQIGSPTYTYDLADATIRLIDAGATGVWHVTNAEATNWHDFAAAILKQFDLKVPLARISTADWRKSHPESALRPAYSVLDISPYSKLTGQALRSWQEALKDYSPGD